MKKLFALLAGALCFGVAIAGTIDRATLERPTWYSELAAIPAADAQSQLEALKPEIAQSQVFGWLKNRFAQAEAFTYARNTEGVTYQQIVDKFVEARKELELPGEPSDYDKLICGMNYFNGLKADTVEKECLTANKDNLVTQVAIFQYAQLLYKHEGMEAAEPYYRQSKVGLGHLASWYRARGNNEKAVEIFWEAALSGNLAKPDIELLREAVTAEYTKDDFDAAVLKNKLTRVIGLTRIRVRAWKPTVEGEVNPWLSFIGAIQDTIKDL